MAGIAGLEIFEIKGWEIVRIFRGVDGMAKVVVDLEVLGPCGGGKEQGHDQQGAGAERGCTKRKCRDLHMQMI